MKKLLISIYLLTLSAVAYASCTTNTIFGADGKMTVCTTCCVGSSCNTTCI